MKSNKVVLYVPEKFRVESYDIEPKGIIVKPTYLSICNADIRYYMGDRPMEVLKRKLPLVLIHEAVGEVISSDDSDYAPGDNVVVVPILRDVSPLETEYNYDYPGSKFMSSSKDGCMQSLIQLSRENVVKYSGIQPEYATTVEVASIAMQALKRLDRFYNRKMKKVAIWGTGSVAFWTALLMKVTMPDTHITIIGRSPKKLEAFTFVEETVILENLVPEEEYDLVVEAVGGYGTEEVLSKSISMVKPVGCILMLGVSELAINVNTRGWMEKGVVILTSHRSTYEDFVDVVNLVEKSEFIQKNIQKSVSRIKDINCLDDIHDAISMARVYQFKTVMRWNLNYEE